MNSTQFGGLIGKTGNNDEMVDKSYRRFKSKEHKPKEASSSEDSLHTDSEEEP